MRKQKPDYCRVPHETPSERWSVTRPTVVTPRRVSTVIAMLAVDRAVAPRRLLETESPNPLLRPPAPHTDVPAVADDSVYTVKHIMLNARFTDPAAPTYYWTPAGSNIHRVALIVVLWPLSFPLIPLLYGCASTLRVLVNLGFILRNPADGASSPGVRAWRRRVVVFHHGLTLVYVIALVASLFALSTPMPTPAWHMVWMQLLVVTIGVVQRRFGFVSSVRCAHLVGSSALQTADVFPFLQPMYTWQYALAAAHALRIPAAYGSVVTEACYTATQRALDRLPPSFRMPPLDAVRRTCPNGVLRLPSGAPVVACAVRGLASPGPSVSHPGGAVDDPAGPSPREVAEAQRLGRVIVDGQTTLPMTGAAIFYGPLVLKRMAIVIVFVFVATLASASAPFVVRATLPGVPVLGDTTAQGVAFVCFCVTEVLMVLVMPSLFGGGFALAVYASVHAVVATAAHMTTPPLRSCDDSAVIVPVGGSGGDAGRSSSTRGSRSGDGAEIRTDSESTSYVRAVGARSVRVVPFPFGDPREVPLQAPNPAHLLTDPAFHRTLTRATAGGWPLDCAVAVTSFTCAIRGAIGILATPIVFRSVLFSGLPPLISIAVSLTLALLFTIDRDSLAAGLPTQYQTPFETAVILPTITMLVSVLVHGSVLLAAFVSLANAVAELQRVRDNLTGWCAVIAERLAAAGCAEHAAAERLSHFCADEAEATAAAGSGDAQRLELARARAAARRTQVESAALLEQLHVVDATIVGGIERSPGLRFLGVVKPGVGGIGGGIVALATIIVLGVRVANVLASGG